MNKARCCLLALVLALCGCAHQYVIKLNNGAQIVTAGKPRLVGSNYVFKDSAGRQNSIPRIRIREIAPASMAKEEFPFKSTPAR